MKLLQKIGNICLVFLCILSTLTSVFYVLYHYNFKSTTSSSFYIGEQSPTDLISKSDELTETQIAEYEKRVLLNVNLYTNEKQNGIALSEMRLDYFTDYTMDINSCRSTGIQYMGDVAGIVRSLEDGSFFEKYTLDDFYSLYIPYYYESYQGVSWSGGYESGMVEKPLTRDFSFICKIDDTPYLFQLDGSYDYKVTSGWWIFKKTETKTYYYDYYDLLLELLSSVRSNSKGYGDYYLSIDISKYFTNIRAYNFETQQFDKIPDTDISKKYCMMKFHYTDNGAVSSDNSMFGLIECNPNYRIDKGSFDDIEYWQERFVYNVDSDDLSYRYSELFDGYFVSLPFEDKEIFESMPRIKVNVVLDLNSNYLTTNNINVIGFDYNAFENVELDTLTIYGSGNFKFLDKAFYNTDLKFFKHSSSLECEYGSDVFTNEFSEVLL